MNANLAELRRDTSHASTVREDEDAPTGYGIPDRHACPGVWIEGATFDSKRPKGEQFGISYGSVIGPPILTGDKLVIVFEDFYGVWKLTASGNPTDLAKLGRLFTQARWRRLHPGGGVVGFRVEKAT